MKSFIHTCLMVTIGCYIFSIGLNMFYIPHNLLSGGISGVCVIIYYMTGMSFGLSNILINIPITAIALKFLGKRYMIISIFGTLMISLSVDSLSFLSHTQYIQNPILSATFGGVLIGVGTGLIYRYNGTSGGLDVIAAIVKKFYSFEMGSFVFAINCLIMAVAAYLFNLELAVLTLVGMYLSAVMTNKVVVGLNLRKTAFIVSYKADTISDAIIREVGRGATLLYGHGAFTKDMKKVIFVVINLTQIAKLKSIVTSVDPDAFLFITPTADVMGTGFTKNKPEGNLPKKAKYFRDEEGRLYPISETITKPVTTPVKPTISQSPISDDFN